MKNKRKDEFLLRELEFSIGSKGAFRCIPITGDYNGYYITLYLERVFLGYTSSICIGYQGREISEAVFERTTLVKVLSRFLDTLEIEKAKFVLNPDFRYPEKNENDNDDNPF